MLPLPRAQEPDTQSCGELQKLSTASEASTELRCIPIYLGFSALFFLKIQFHLCHRQLHRYSRSFRAHAILQRRPNSNLINIAHNCLIFACSPETEEPIGYASRVLGVADGARKHLYLVVYQISFYQSASLCPINALKIESYV